MSLCGCLSKEQAEYLYQLEQETEIANVMAIPENIQRVKELVSQGERVILISDMYLPRDVIYKMLIKRTPSLPASPCMSLPNMGSERRQGTCIDMYRRENRFVMRTGFIQAIIFSGYRGALRPGHGGKAVMQKRTKPF